jgi:hypothetical protein
MDPETAGLLTFASFVTPRDRPDPSSSMTAGKKQNAPIMKNRFT